MGDVQDARDKVSNTWILKETEPEIYHKDKVIKSHCLRKKIPGLARHEISFHELGNQSIA
jgi:hypothetical protein